MSTFWGPGCADIGSSSGKNDAHDGESSVTYQCHSQSHGELQLEEAVCAVSAEEPDATTGRMAPWKDSKQKDPSPSSKGSPPSLVKENLRALGMVSDLPLSPMAYRK